MPTVEASARDLCNLIGKKLSIEQLKESVEYAKGEVDAVIEGNLQIDIKDTNRPDLWSAEGIARQLKGNLGIERGLPKYEIRKSNLVVKIEKSVKRVRPLTVCAVIKEVKVTEDFLIQMIRLQEKVDMTFGRKRKESAIGIYDYDKIHGNIRYYGAEPMKTKFVPLEFKQPLDLDEILELHPKGLEYGHLLKEQKRYPIFEDSKGHILSMPPIINSNYSGKITGKTKNVFIEVSGFDGEIIATALNVLVAAFADRGGKIYSVKIIDSNGKVSWTPDFTHKKISVDIGEIKKLSGLELKNKKIIDLLRKSRYDAKLKGKKVECLCPAYRSDILHQVDVIEDIVIACGYNKIEPLPIKMPCVGRGAEETKYLDIVRELCVGLGLQEVLTFTLTSKNKQGALVGLENGQLVEIANPVSENWVVFRKNIFPELLDFLSKNKHVLYPQKIFEVGKAVELNPKRETRVEEKNKLCIVVCDRRANFTLIKSVLDAVCNNLGLEYKLNSLKHTVFEEGKSAAIVLGNKSGVIGEIRKNILRNFGLEIPVTVLEIEI